LEANVWVGANIGESESEREGGRERERVAFVLFHIG